MQEKFVVDLAEEKSGKKSMLPLYASIAIIAIIVGAFFYFYWQLIEDIILSRLGFGVNAKELLPLAVQVISILVATEIFLFISRMFLRHYFDQKGKKKDTDLVLQLYSYAVWAIVILLLVAAVFKSIGAFITSIGLIGFGVTFALQKPILNFVGWLTIIINKPFVIGDRIELTINGKTMKGDVENVQVMYTSLKALRENDDWQSGKDITLPNEFILTSPIVNYTKSGELVWDDLTVTVTYDCNWKKAIEVLEKVASAVMEKYVKAALVSESGGKGSLNEAVRLLKEASKRISRGIVKQKILDKIEVLSSAQAKQGAMEIERPDIKVELQASAIGLNIRYLSDARQLRAMRDEIARRFLEEVAKHKDVVIAYPHLKIV